LFFSKAITLARFVYRGFGYAVLYFLLGILTSLVSTIFGVFFTVALPFGWTGALAVVAIPVIPIIAFPIGFLLSMPVTFVVCPIVTLLLKHRPATNLIACSFAGAVTGGLVTWSWIARTHMFEGLAVALVPAGTAAGFVAGMTYATMAGTFVERGRKEPIGAKAA